MNSRGIPKIEYSQLFYFWLLSKDKYMAFSDCNRLKLMAITVIKTVRKFSVKFIFSYYLDLLHDIITGYKV